MEKKRKCCRFIEQISVLYHTIISNTFQYLAHESHGLEKKTFSATLYSTSNRMHILFLTRKFLPERGGMETFSAQLTQHYSGAKTIVAYSTQQKDIWWVAALLFVRGLFGSRRASVLHLGDLVLAPVGVLIKKLTGKPIVVTVHGLELTYPNPTLRRLIDWSLPSIDHFVAVSQHTASIVKERGVAEERISVIPHGVIPPSIIAHAEARQQIAAALSVSPAAIESKLLITTVGRLIKRKGVAWFIANVLPALKALNPLYLVASDGPERADIERVIRVHQMQDYVRLLGRVDDAGLQSLYYGSDLFVFPNISVPGDAEGFGFVAVEAAAAGLPVIASRIDGIPDAIHHEQNGLLVAPGEAAGYIEAITYWAHHPIQRRRFGETARAYTVEHFRWEHVAKQYQELFATITAASIKPPYVNR